MDEPKSVALPENLADLSPEGPAVSVVFGSASDWPTMKAAVELLEEFGVPCEHGVVSAHRTPDRLAEYSRGAAARGVKVIIGAAGGAAHLPGMIAAWTTLPVLGVPIKSRALSGVDSLHSIAQMPGGVPVGTLAIGDAGAKNAGILAASIIALQDDSVAAKLDAFREKQTASVAEIPVDET